MIVTSQPSGVHTHVLHLGTLPHLPFCPHANPQMTPPKHLIAGTGLILELHQAHHTHLGRIAEVNISLLQLQSGLGAHTLQFPDRLTRYLSKHQMAYHHAPAILPHQVIPSILHVYRTPLLILHIVHPHRSLHQRGRTHLSGNPTRFLVDHSPPYRQPCKLKETILIPQMNLTAGKVSIMGQVLGHQICHGLL